MAFKSMGPTPKVRRTLSFRIVTAFMVLLTFVLLVIALLATITLRNSLIDETDRNLRSSGRTLASITVDQLLNGSKSQVLPSDFYLYITYNRSNDLALPVGDFELINNQVAERYGTPANPEQLAYNETSIPFTVPSTLGRQEWRVITLDLQLTPTTLTSVGSVIVGLPLQPIEHTVANLFRTFVILLLAVFAVGALVSHFLVDRSLTGLRDIERATHEVAAGNLSVRVPTGTEGSEVALLGESINKMLSHVEHSFAVQSASEQRMRQFVSDASHELRTPLATVRGYAELYRLGGVPDDEVAGAMSRIESESVRMAHLVDDLLQLARLDERRKIKMQPEDLAVIALNTVNDFKVRAPQRPAQVIGLNGQAPQSVVVNADAERVTQVITNLLSNVLSHTPEGTQVEVAVGVARDGSNGTGAAVGGGGGTGSGAATGTGATAPAPGLVGIVEVRDHGPGIPIEEWDRVFERFYRTDSSRSRGSGGSGLGLAIVAAIMQIHGGSAEVAQTPGGGLTVRLKFPGVLQA